MFSITSVLTISPYFKLHKCPYNVLKSTCDVNLLSKLSIIFKEWRVMSNVDRGGVIVLFVLLYFNKVQWVDFKLENVLVSLHSLKTMGLGPFEASAPLFLRNRELPGHSPIHIAESAMKPLSKIWTYILSIVKTGLQSYCNTSYSRGGVNQMWIQSYCNTSYSRGGVNQMWILKNSKDLLEYI